MGFLDHLAGMALGVKPASAARPSLPAIFAAPSFAIGTQQGLEAVEQSRPPSAKVARDLPGPERRAPRIEAPVAPVQERQQQQPEEVPPGPSSPRLSPPPPEPRAPETRTPEIPAASARGRSPVHASHDHVPAARQAAPKSEPPPAPRMLFEAPTERAVTRAAPLSDAVIAGRPSAVREQGPVIHVTIDRLDVRAAAPAKAPVTPQRPRPQPAVSLSDYLRGGRQ